MSNLDAIAAARAAHDRAPNLIARRAALARMTVLAGRLGLTVPEALAELDAPPPAPPSPPALVQPERPPQPQPPGAVTYPRRVTNGEKRTAVLALLGSGLSDREIARRAGVAPSTVANTRKAQA